MCSNGDGNSNGNGFDDVRRELCEHTVCESRWLSNTACTPHSLTHTHTTSSLLLCYVSTKCFLPHRDCNLNAQQQDRHQIHIHVYKHVFTFIAAFSHFFFYARRGSRCCAALPPCRICCCCLSVAIVAIATTDTKMKMKNSKATLRARISLCLSSTRFCFLRSLALPNSLSLLSPSVYIAAAAVAAALAVPLPASLWISRSFVSLLTLAVV